MKTVFLRRSVLALSLAALSLGGFSLQAHAQDPAKKNLVIGGTAVSTSSGVIRYFRHAMFMASCRLLPGQDPGLKSVATATGTPAPIISRAGA